VLTHTEVVPSFRVLVTGWGTTVLLNRQLAPGVIEAHRLALADTLFAAKDASQPLADWLAHLRDGFVERFLPSDSTYDDVRGQFAGLLRESAEGALANATLRSFGRQVGDPHVLNLVTLHSAKGLEFDSVILVGLEEGVLPRWGAGSDDDLVEARRVFYVGLTRARHEVHVTYSGFTKNAYGRRFINGPSRFVLELQERLESGA
jgi:DNA helicase-2/ATP-dependent DNA helicase PcrA